MSGKRIRFSDPNCYHEAVLAYREQFNLMPNRGYRSDIAITIRSYEDLCIWQDLIAHWGYMKDGKWKPRNPLDVKSLLTVFEMKQREAQRKKDEIQQRALSARSGSSIPRRSVGSMRESQLFRLSKGSGDWKG